MEKNPGIYPQEDLAQAQLLNNQGKFHSIAHEWEQAEDCFQRALNLLELCDEKLPSLQIVLLTGLANVKTQCGRYEDAENDLHKALAISKGNILDQTCRMGEIYYWLGVNSAIWGKIEEASARFDEAINLFTRTKSSRENILNTLFQQTEVLMRLNRCDKAQESLFQIFELCNEQDSPFVKIRAFILQGQLQFEVEQMELGRKSYEEAYAIFKQNADMLMSDERSIPALNSIAQAFLEIKRCREAVEIFEGLVHRVENRSVNDLRSINLFNNLAIAYDMLSEQFESHHEALNYVRKAYDNYLRAADLCKKMPTLNPPMTIKLLTNSAMCLSRLEEWNSARTLMEQAEQLADLYGFNQEREYNTIVGSFSDILIRQGDFQSALPYLNQNLSISQQRYGELSAKTALVHFQLGRAYFYLGHWEKALEHDCKIVDHFFSTETFDQFIALVNRITQSYKNLRQAPQYILYSNKLIDAYFKFSKAKDANYFSCLIRLCELYAEMGQIRKAEEICLRGIFEAGYGSIFQGPFLIELCLIFSNEHLQDMTKVENYYAELKKIGIEVLAKDYQNCWRLAQLFMVRNDYGQALLFAEKAEKMITNLSDLNSVEELANVYLQIAEVNRIRNNPPSHQVAIDCYRKVLSIFSDNPIFNTDRAKVLNNLALCLTNIGDFQSAVLHFESAIDIIQKTDSDAPELISILCNLVQCHLNGGNIDKARKCVQQAEELCNCIKASNLPLKPIDQALILNCQGKIELQMGNFDRAIQRFETVFKMMQNSSSPNIVNILSNIGMAYLKKGEKDVAHTKFHEALHTLKKLGLSESDLTIELQALMQQTL
jgi:tetratricopeptide (TPR) repeat protein